MQVAVGSTVAYGVRGPRIQPALKAACVFFHENHCKTQLLAQAPNLLQCLDRLSLPPSD